ncbi:MAG: YqcI/YcgG family protein [Bacteroidetes bacterium]|nr:YqcI/YcgG family protein [Candidatus Colenecus caballi]
MLLKRSRQTARWGLTFSGIPAYSICAHPSYAVRSRYSHATALTLTRTDVFPLA